MNPTDQFRADIIEGYATVQPPSYTHMVICDGLFSYTAKSSCDELGTVLLDGPYATRWGAERALEDNKRLLGEI